MSSPFGDKLVGKEDVSGAGVLSPGRRVVSPVVIGEDVSQVELSPVVVGDVVTSVAGMRYGVLTSGVAIFISTNGQYEWFANACTSAWLSYPVRVFLN